MAGSITHYSKSALQDLGSALLRFAHPEGDEKTVEELEALIERIERSPARAITRAPRIHEAAKRLGPGPVAELVAKYEAGSPAQALADEFNIGISTVLRLVRSQGGSVRGHGVPSDVRAEARRLYESGLSAQKVADRLELTKTVALRTIQKSGAAMRPQKNKPR